MSSFQGANEPRLFEPMQIDSLEEPLQPLGQNRNIVSGGNMTLSYTYTDIMHFVLTFFNL